MRVSWRFVLIALGVGYLIAAPFLVGYWVLTPMQTKPRVPTHTYNYVDGSGEKTSWQGESIRSNGFCVEIILHGRVDTILCPGHAITEAIEETAQPAPEPRNPDAIIPLPPLPPNVQAKS